MKLNSSLKLKVEEHPIFTILRSFSNDIQSQFEEIPTQTKPLNLKYNYPSSFDGSVVWRDYLSPIRNQKRCGSCWAFASTSTLADRFNIQSKGKFKLELSPTKMIICDFLKDETTLDSEEKKTLNIQNIQNGACNGSSLFDAWKYLYIVGTNTEECVPYDKALGNKLNFMSLSNFEKNEQLPFCNVTGPIGDMCVDISMDQYSDFEYGTPARFYRCFHYYTVPGTSKDGGDDSDICQEIYKWGPVSTGMLVYPDFYSFDAKNDIYEWNGKDAPIGGHAVQIVGWGEKNGKKYWVIRNSWGENWGRNGFFHMIRGKNECQIEENVVTGLPDFFYPADYKLDFLDNWSETRNDILKRQKTENLKSSFGGGIDSQTGFTRRNIVSKPWFDLRSPISVSELPNWNDFVAGRDVISKKKRRKWLSLFITFLIFVVILLVCLKF